MDKIIHDYSSLEKEITKSVEKTVRESIINGLVQGQADAFAKGVSVNASGLQVETKGVKEALEKSIKGELKGKEIELPPIKIKAKRIEGIDVASLFDFDDKKIQSEINRHYNALAEGSVVQEKTAAKKLIANYAHAELRGIKVDEVIKDYVSELIREYKLPNDIVDQFKRQFNAIADIGEEQLKKMSSAPLKFDNIQDGIDQVKNLNKEISNTRSNLASLVKDMKRPAFHVGDLRDETLRGDNYDPADSLKKTIERKQTTSLGTGTYWTENIADALDTMAEFLEQGQNKILYVTDLASQTKNMVNINSEEGYDVYVKFLSDINSYIMNMAEVVNKNTYAKNLSKSGITNIDTLYASGKEYFSKFNVTQQQLSEFITQTVSYVKANFNKLNAKDINSLIQKKLFKATGVDVGKSDSLDNYGIGSVVFDFDKNKTPVYTIDPNSISQELMKEFYINNLRNKATNKYNDIDDMLAEYSDALGDSSENVRNELIAIQSKAEEIKDIDFDNFASLRSILSAVSSEDGLSNIVNDFKELIKIALDSGNSVSSFFDAIKNGSIESSSEVDKLLQSLGILKDNSLKYNSLENGTRHSDGFVSDEYSVIARPQEYEQKTDALTPKLLEAEKLGANVSSIVGKIKNEATGMIYEIQKTSKGKIIDDENFEYLQATDKQILKLISDLKILQQLGLYVDTGGQNILYDKEKGFSFIDLAIPKDAKNVPDYMQNSMKGILEEVFENLLPYSGEYDAIFEKFKDNVLSFSELDNTVADIIRNVAKEEEQSAKNVAEAYEELGKAKAKIQAEETNIGTRVAYHYGKLSSDQQLSHQFGDEIKAWSNGLRNNGRGWADGTGTYVTSDPNQYSKGKFDDELKKFYAIDTSKLNLFEAHIEEDAEQYYEFIHKLEQFCLKVGSGFKGFDSNLEDVNVEGLFQLFQNVFKDSKLTFDEFSNFINNMETLVKESGMREDGSFDPNRLFRFKKQNGSDDIKTRFMKMLGYQGTDLSGTSYDLLESGSVLFDTANVKNNVIKSGKQINDVEHATADQDRLQSEIRETGQVGEDTTRQISSGMQQVAASTEEIAEQIHVVDDEIEVLKNGDKRLVKELEQTSSSAKDFGTVIANSMDEATRAIQETAKAQQKLRAEMEGQNFNTSRMMDSVMPESKNYPSFYKKAENLAELREQYKLLININRDIEKYNNPDNYAEDGTFNIDALKIKGSLEELKAYKAVILSLNPQLNDIADSTEKIGKKPFAAMFGEGFGVTGIEVAKKTKDIKDLIDQYYVLVQLNQRIADTKPGTELYDRFVQYRNELLQLNPELQEFADHMDATMTPKQLQDTFGKNYEAHKEATKAAEEHAKAEEKVSESAATASKSASSKTKAQAESHKEAAKAAEEHAEAEKKVDKAASSEVFQAEKAGIDELISKYTELRKARIKGLSADDDAATEKLMAQIESIFEKRGVSGFSEKNGKTIFSLAQVKAKWAEQQEAESKAETETKSFFETQSTTSAEADKIIQTINLETASLEELLSVQKQLSALNWNMADANDVSNMAKINDALNERVDVLRSLSAANVEAKQEEISSTDSQVEGLRSVGDAGKEAGEKVRRSQEEIQAEIENTNKTIQDAEKWIKHYSFLDADYTTPGRGVANAQMKGFYEELIKEESGKTKGTPDGLDYDRSEYYRYQLYKSIEEAKSRGSAKSVIDRYSKKNYSDERFKEVDAELRADLEHYKKTLEEAKATLVKLTQEYEDAKAAIIAPGVDTKAQEASVGKPTASDDYKSIINNLKEIHKLEKENIKLETGEKPDTSDHSKLEANKAEILRLNKEIEASEKRIAEANAQNAAKEEEIASLISRQKSELEGVRTKSEANVLQKAEADEKRFDNRIRSSIQNELNKDISHIRESISKGQMTDGLTDIFKSLLVDLTTFKQKFDAATDTSEAQADFDILRKRIEEAFGKEKLDEFKRAEETTISSLKNQIDKYMVSNSGMGSEYMASFDRLKGQLSTAKTEADIKRLRAAFADLKAEVDKAGVSGKSFFDTVRNMAVSSSARFLSTYFSLQDWIRYARTAFDTIRELDYALVDLKKTSSMTSGQMDDFYYSANNVAKQMGVTTQQIIEQASSWSRLGYSTQYEATEMAKLSSQFKAISPGMDLQNATDGLVSVQKAFDIDVSDTLDEIMSKINIVGNTAATSNDEIVEMLKRSSAAMAEANNNLEETIALETAAVEITRNAESIGTAFRTISMRIRGYDEEGELLDTAEYEDLTGKIANLTKTAKSPGGISLFTDKDKTTFKSTYEILKDIRDIYDDLTDKQQAQLLEALGGKRGGQALSALFRNWEAVDKALLNMRNSMGSASREMSIVEESIEFKLNALKQTWTGTIQQIASRQTIGNMVDGLTAISELLSNAIKLFGDLPTAVGTLGAAGVALFTNKKNDGRNEYPSFSSIKMPSCYSFESFPQEWVSRIAKGRIKRSRINRRYGSHRLLLLINKRTGNSVEWGTPTS